MALANAIKYAFALRNPSATQIVPSNLSFLKKITVSIKVSCTPYCCIRES